MNKQELNKNIRIYAKPNNSKAIFQIVNTLIPYIVILSLSFKVFNQGRWAITAMLSFISALLMVRVFILFHDCTHGSFTSNQRMNHVLGSVFGIFSFTPFVSWQKEHAIHHGAVGNLDRRGIGDIWTMTTEEFLQKPLHIQRLYRLFRNPLFLFTIAPFFKFLVLNRLPKVKATFKEHMSNMITNIGILFLSIYFSMTYSLVTYGFIQFIVLFMASSIGLWLFYVQHQFEDVYWENKDTWNSMDAAMKGSTFYKLPAIFEWFSGYIGYHHIHHLNSKIPNYHLKACYTNHHELKDVKTVKFFESIPLAFLQLYDVESKKLISFKQFNKSIKA